MVIDPGETQVLEGRLAQILKEAVVRCLRRKASRLHILQHGAQFDATHLKVTLFYYAVFIAVDYMTAAVAFMFEKREDRRLLWWLALQRFGYRQLLYYVLAKSVANAAKGHLVGWGKLDRKATVDIDGVVPRSP